MNRKGNMVQDSPAFISTAPGNVFLAGEHAVVYGHPAVVAAIGLQTTVTTYKCRSEGIHIVSDAYGRAEAHYTRSGWSREGAEEMIPLLRLVEQVCASSDLAPALSIRISSEVPPQSGLGSSSTVLVAILGSVSRALGMEIPIEDYFSWLYTFQVELHGGRASGTEFATACFGGFHRAARLETADGPRLLRQRLSCPQFKVVIGDTRIPAPTKIAAGKVMPQMMKQDQAKIEKAFKAIAELVPSAEAALLSGNMKALGNVMTENQKILRDDLRVSHPKLDSLVEAALRAGAYGAKLSGGGMGGVMFAVADPTRMEAVASALKEAGARVFTTNLGGSGVACTRD